MSEYIRQRYWNGYTQKPEERIDPAEGVNKVPIGKKRIPNSREYPDITESNLVHSPDNISSSADEQAYLDWCRKHWPSDKEQSQITTRLVRRKELRRESVVGVGRKLRQDIAL